MKSIELALPVPVALANHQFIFFSKIAKKRKFNLIIYHDVEL